APQALLHVLGQLGEAVGDRELLHRVVRLGVCGERLAHLLGPAEPPAQREVLAQRISFGVGLPHQDAPQIGMAPERHAEHVVDLALQPVRAPPQRHDRVHGEVTPRSEPYLRSQGVDGGVHAERNWWTELPNGSEISSIVSGGSRRPRSSSGCSCRSAGSSSDSPLIFLWRSSTPYSRPSGRGGQPGTYTSTGT